MTEIAIYFNNAGLTRTKINLRKNEKSFAARIGGNMKFTVYNEKYRDILF